MPNTRNRENLRAQVDLLADGHREICEWASKANGRIVDADERMARGETSATVPLKMAARNLDTVDELLAVQEARITRVRAEIREIAKNLKMI